MKMNQKGIATAAVVIAIIAGVVIIIAVVGVGAFLMLRGYAPVVVVEKILREAEVPRQAEVPREVEVLPSIDQARGTEPLARYPGSVMLSHGTATFVDGTMVEIGYGTMDSIDTVVNWYKTTALAGWTQEMEWTEGIEGGKMTTLKYVKGAKRANITVSWDQFTIINLMHITMPEVDK